MRKDSIFDVQEYTMQNAKKRAAAGADDVLCMTFDVHQHDRESC